MLGRLFSRPKWQHRNAAVRQEGVSELPEGDSSLAALARTDPDARVRRQAVRRLLDADLLLELAASDADEGVRDGARQRLCRLAAGEEGASLTAARREALAWRLDDEQSMLYLLRHAAEGVRRLVLERVERPALLAEIALKDPAIELRLTAVERIDQLPTLERLAKEARGQDKKVARRAREKAEALREAEERPQRQRDLEAALRQLVDHAMLDIVRFRRLADEWDALQTGAPAELAARVQALIAEFARLYAAQQSAAEHQARRRELCERAETLLHECEDLGAGRQGAAADALRLIERAWAGLDAEGGAAAQGDASRFAEALGRIRRRLEALDAEQAARDRLGEVIAALKALAEGEATPTTAGLEDIQQRWLSLSRGKRGPLAHELTATYQGLRQRALGRIDEARQEIKKLAAELEPLLDNLDAALNEGALHKASALNDKIRHRRDRLHALQWTPPASLDKRLRRLSGRLAELRDWRTFGAGQAREDLTARMQSLIDSDNSPPALAAEIRRLQEQWRALDRSAGLASESQRQAFNAAAERAFAPCAAYFAAQEAERRDHAAQRSAFCDDLEQLLASIDEDYTDWPALEGRLRQARKAWRALGGVESAEWRRLNGRFTGLVGQLEDRLQPERERERLRRERLIDRVEALLQEPDARRAAEELKAAQAAWPPSVPASRKDEQALWRRFKRAADALYSQIAEQRDEQRQAVEEGRRLRESLCHTAEMLAAAQAGADADARRQASAELAALKEQWRAASRLPSRMAAAFDRRFEQACDAFARGQVEAQRRAEAQERARWAERARLCETLEARLGQGMDAAGLEAQRRHWQSLPPLIDGQTGRDFDSRFEQLCESLAGEGAPAEVLTANEAALRHLCLELEILAGIDTPAQFAEERLALQVQRLPQAMMARAERDDRDRRLRKLLVQWYLCGPVTPEARARLQPRLQAALAALGEDASA